MSECSWTRHQFNWTPGPNRVAVFPHDGIGSAQLLSLTVEPLESYSSERGILRCYIGTRSSRETCDVPALNVVLFKNLSAASVKDYKLVPSSSRVSAENNNVYFEVTFPSDSVAFKRNAIHWIDRILTVLAVSLDDQRVIYQGLKSEVRKYHYHEGRWMSDLHFLLFLEGLMSAEAIPQFAL